ncbi:MAG: ATP-binding cassette domain-containing protein [Limnobacter sp.]|nr:ATP-binding cassette domain-containing protein [Limnobacter sp.]
MIQITDLHLARGAKMVLKGANLTIYPKEKIGLIGHNGAGKTSLLAAVLGELGPDQGSIDIPGTWKIASIAQEVPNSDITVLDFALEGDQALMKIRRRIQEVELLENQEELSDLYEALENIDGYRAESRVASILHGLGFSAVDLTRAVREFSGGWKMRMNLARVLGSRAEFVLLDEPTNHLDIDAVVWLEQWIRTVEATVLLVSHDRDFLDNVCTHSVHLNDQVLTKYTGGYSAFERAFAEKSEQISQQNRKTQMEMAHLQSFVDRFKAKASKAKQAQSRVKRLERLQMIETMSVDKTAELRFLEPHKAPDPLVVLNQADCGYSDTARILEKVILEIRPGDRLGLLGANGNGKTTLVKTIVGSLPLVAGERVEGKGLVCGYFAQNEIESLDWDSTPIEHLHRLDRNASEQKMRSFLAQYHFQDDKIRQKVGSFSGGEKSRLALALIAYTRPNLLLLDEPTNHLDIGSRQSLATGLIDFEGALVVVSHDRHLLESITDRYLWVHDGKVQEFDGDLQDYAQAIRQYESQKAAQLSGKNKTVIQAITEAPKPVKQVKPEISREERNAAHQTLKKLRNQVKKAEQDIEKFQFQLKQLDDAIAAVDYANPDAAASSATLGGQRTTVMTTLDTLEEQLLEWMLECEKLEQIAA